jgi:predicted permease
MNLFLVSFYATLKIFIFIVAGYFLFKLKYFKKLYSILLFYTVNIAIPVLILYRFSTTFNLVMLKKSILLPIYGFILIVLGYFIGKKLSNILNLPLDKKNYFISSLMFSNCGYYPLPLFQTIFQGEDIALAQIYIFFFGFIYTTLIWSWGLNIITNKNFEKIGRFKFSVPFYAIIIGILLSFINIKKFLLPEIEYIVKIISESGMILILILMGGGLSDVKLKNIKIGTAVIIVTLFRLIFLPLIAIPFIYFMKFDLIFRTVLLVETGVPVAVNIVIISQKYNKNSKIEFLFSIIVLNYLASIFTVPILIFVAQNIL